MIPCPVFPWCIRDASHDGECQCECEPDSPAPGALWPWGVDGDEDRAVVERCDMCQRLEDDHAAARAVAAVLEEERATALWAHGAPAFAAVEAEDGRAALAWGGREMDAITARAVSALHHGAPFAKCRRRLCVALTDCSPYDGSVPIAGIVARFQFMADPATAPGFEHMGTGYLRGEPLRPHLLTEPKGEEWTALEDLAKAISSARAVRRHIMGSDDEPETE